MNQLDALKQFTTVVADSGDFKQSAQFKPIMGVRFCNLGRIQALAATAEPRTCAMEAAAARALDLPARDDDQARWRCARNAGALAAGKPVQGSRVFSADVPRLEPLMGAA